MMISLTCGRNVTCLGFRAHGRMSGCRWKIMVQWAWCCWLVIGLGLEERGLELGHVNMNVPYVAGDLKKVKNTWRKNC